MQAAFGSWLWVQGATFLAVFPVCCCFGILIILALPYTRDNYVVVRDARTHTTNRWWQKSHACHMDKGLRTMGTVSRACTRVRPGVESLRLMLGTGFYSSGLGHRF